MSNSAPYEIKLSPSQTVDAFVHFNTMLLFDVPSGIQLCLDGQPFLIGEKFKGVKMIPPGMHHLAIDRPEIPVLATVSYFVHFERSEIWIRKWDPVEETLKEMEDSEQEERLRLGIQNFDFDKNLAPYDSTRYSFWQRLVSWIDLDQIRVRMNGLHCLCIAQEALGMENLSRKVPSETVLRNQFKKTSQSSQKACLLNYTSFPYLIKEKDCLAETLSALNLDKTETLRKLLQKEYQEDWRQLLGELEFAFVAFRFGNSVQSLEQWKSVVHFVLGCFEMGISHSKFLQTFLKVIRYQIQELIQRNEERDETNELLSQSFLKMDILEFLTVGHTMSNEWSSALKKEHQKLEKWIQETFDWHLDEVDDDECAPVIVDLSKN